MEALPEIVELDCRKYWRRSKLPDEIQEDMRRCDSVWVPVPLIPKNPRMTLEWEWVWRPWEWREGPSLPKQARFDMEAEVTLPDALLDSLRVSVEVALEAQLREKVKGVSFALFLCVSEKYTQGLVVGEEKCAASLQKAYVLLGRRDGVQ